MLRSPNLCSIWFYFDKNENRKVRHKPFLRQNKTWSLERCNILEQGCVSHQSSFVFHHSEVHDHPHLDQNLLVHKFPSKTQSVHQQLLVSHIFEERRHVCFCNICNLTLTCLCIKFNFKIIIYHQCYPLSLWLRFGQELAVHDYIQSVLTSFNSPSTCFIAPILANLPTMFAKELFCPSSLWVMTSINALSTSPKISTVKQRTCKKQCKNLESETRSENIT